MSNLDLSVFDSDVLVQVAEMLQFLRDNEKDAPLHHHVAQIISSAPAYSTVKPSYNLTLNANKTNLVTVIARAMLALEAMNE